MGRVLALPLLCCLTAAALTAAGRSDAPAAQQPDGLLVLGAVASRDASGAVMREQVIVADPSTGATRSHRLPGGTLCGGSVLAGGDGVVFSSYRGRHGVALTLPLDLRGRPRSLGRADVMAPIGATGRLVRGGLDTPRTARSFAVSAGGSCCRAGRRSRPASAAACS